MIYGYSRVSTKGQAKDGNSLEAQEQTLTDNGAVKIFRDSFTGMRADRPELNKLLEILSEGDTLMVTKLDRIARSITQGIELIDKLLERGVKINILNMGLIDNSPSNKFVRCMFFAFAEFERDMIVERTQEGKAIARQDPDFREGRPKVYNKKQINHALELLETKTYKQVEECTGISKSTLIRAKRATYTTEA
jgi:DNA invertase Pin-like site-specific DNA recombinase